jgi:hypothetical protein
MRYLEFLTKPRWTVNNILKTLAQDQTAQYNGIYTQIKHLAPARRKRPMKLARFLPLAIALPLSACALLTPPSVTPGENESTVISRLGKPTGVYQDGPDRLLEYRTNPGGQATYMVRVDNGGHAKSLEQVLTTDKFATIKPGVDTPESVLRKVGAPYEKSYLSLSKQDVWTYMYRDQGVWDNLMHVQFGQDGKVSMLMNAPDLSRRPVAGGGHGM